MREVTGAPAQMMTLDGGDAIGASAVLLDSCADITMPLGAQPMILPCALLPPKGLGHPITPLPMHTLKSQLKIVAMRDFFLQNMISVFFLSLLFKPSYKSFQLTKSHYKKSSS